MGETTASHQAAAVLDAADDKVSARSTQGKLTLVTSAGRGDFPVGEFNGEKTADNLSGLPLPYPDGAAFDVLSDHTDIVLSAAQDEADGPRHIWGEFRGYRGQLVRRVGKRVAGRTLDGVVHDARPSVSEPSL